MTGDGDRFKALDVSRSYVYALASADGTDASSITVMRKDESGQLGTWVKFADALKRSRHEYDEGQKAKAEELDAYIEKLQLEITTSYSNGYKSAQSAMQHELDGRKFDEGYAAGLVKGRKEGQVKTEAITKISAAQLAKEYERGYETALNSTILGLIESHRASDAYHGELAEAEGIIDDVVALLREYQDVKVSGPRGVELAEKLTAFVNENG